MVSTHAPLLYFLHNSESIISWNKNDILFGTPHMFKKNASLFPLLWKFAIHCNIFSRHQILSITARKWKIIRMNMQLSLFIEETKKAKESLHRGVSYSHGLQYNIPRKKNGFFKKLLQYKCTSCQLTISSHQNMVGYLLTHLEMVNWQDVHS